ncbi:hydantoinase/oxoprolinase family protein [Paraburkholderia phenoliruptrix]|uniref:hydantoinase/oxoprolinase family protein n=1 Tax=Paraburkholderia phenoliruptrix TaxID=252970 RepID=UPI0028698EC2|nr:hydantoinase/oxoprolinase family protein [Paraburkholderia phenoliruptrix]WMY10924.1 hydantoinase/oxoprolinase family protein [Paraburkholderia phenoliruptrix]
MKAAGRNDVVSPWRIGVDTGGTFTDLVLVDARGHVFANKSPSVPANPAQGVLEAVKEAAKLLGFDVANLLAECSQFIHGTTVATNLLLERKGAKVGFLCTEGFRDSLEIRRGWRANMWDHRTPWGEVIVPRYLRLPVTERIASSGEVLTKLAEDTVHAAARTFAREGVEAVGICLINSYVNDAHEKRCEDLIREALPRAYVTRSSQVAPIMGEYERASTTAANAYAAPRVLPYLQELANTLKEWGLRSRLLLVQSNGGAISLEQLTARPGSLALSGPAAGLASLELFGRLSGTQNVISIEIGGTSCDVTVVTDGRVATTDSLTINDIVIALPSVDIHTVSTGGGTICTADGAGMIKFGPEGVGARPGPACYGRGGTLPTVTDAHLLLGHLRPGPFAGGHIELDEKLAEKAMRSAMSEPLGATVHDAAAAVLQIADQNIIHAIEEVSLQRGLDPTRYTLVGAGGAGALHAVEVARRLGMTRVFIPRLAGVFCALGMCNAKIRHDLIRALGQTLDGAYLTEVGLEAEMLAIQGRAMLSEDGFHGDRTLIETQVDLRYAGQSWTISLPFAGQDYAQLHEAFDALHLRLYGSSQSQAALEVVSVRVAAYGLLPPLKTDAAKVECQTAPEPAETRCVRIAGDEWIDNVPVYDGTALIPGHRFDGPAVIEEQTTTLLIGLGDRVAIDAFGNYLIDVKPAGAAA